TSTVTTSTSWMYPGLPTAASGASIAAMASELVLVGPDITWRLEPNKAATMHGSTAVARAYDGGSPASAANAIACGSTSTAPSTPASASMRSVRASSSCTHGPNSFARVVIATLAARRVGAASGQFVEVVRRGVRHAPELVGVGLAARLDRRDAAGGGN